MKMLYRLLILYPYWFIRTIIRIVLHVFKTIFCFESEEKRIDQLSGVEFEYFVKELLIKSGYKNVEMTQTSGDYGLDIIAKKKHCTYGFQCKRYQRNIGVSAIQQATAGQSFYDLDQVGVITNAYFTEAAYSLAYSNDVILIDRQELLKMSRKAKLFISRIPFYYYFISLGVCCLCFYEYYLLHQKYLLICGIINLLLFLFMIYKSIYLSSHNKNHHYTIYEYQNKSNTD